MSNNFKLKQKHFKDTAHYRFYRDTTEQASAYGDDDRYHKALFFLIGLTLTTRKHANSIYDFRSRTLIDECLNAPWQTSGTLRICRLAVNLYGGTCFDINKNGEFEPNTTGDYAPYELFNSPEAEYMITAIRILFDLEEPS